MRVLGLAGIASSLAVVQAQKLLEWTETSTNVTYGIAIPEASSAPFDMLISIKAPSNIGWVGFAAGGCMLRSPLLVAWPNGTSVTVSPRWASAYHPPMEYNGTSVKVYSTSMSNATHWTANVLCTGCSSWLGGAVNPSGNSTFGWGVSSLKVEAPSSLSSRIHFHNLGQAHFELDMNKARLSKTDFDGAIKALGG